MPFWDNISRLLQARRGTTIALDVVASRDVRVSPQESLDSASPLSCLDDILAPTRMIPLGAPARLSGCLHRVKEVTMMLEAQRTLENAIQGIRRVAYRREGLRQRGEQYNGDLVEE